MSQQPVEAQVVLTSDNTQYDASMQQSAAQTQQLQSSVSKLGDSLDRLAKNASRKFMHVGIGDVAGITAATVAYGAFEKQMSSLNSMAAVLTKNVTDQTKQFNSYAQQVDQLRSKYAMTTSEAAQLVEQTNRLSDGTAQVSQLENAFVKLGQATGEAPAALEASMLQLTRTMGASQSYVGQYNDTLTQLSKTSGASAGGILQFSQSIAPMARMVGATTQQVMGVSQAFIKAGQDGYSAGNAFNKMVTDIAQSSASGSPQLSLYANLIGTTVDHFQKMNKMEAVTQIFEELNRQGPSAINTLNRLGMDGVRTQRAIAAVAQGGGLRSAISDAMGGAGGATERGSKAASDTMSHQLAQMRQDLQMTGESIGQDFAPPAKAALGIIDSLTGGISRLAQGPLGDLAAAFMAVAAPLSLMVAGMLQLSKLTLAFSGMRLLTGSAGAAGLRAGFGRTGAEVAEGSNWFQRRTFATGQYLGGIGSNFRRFDAEGMPGRTLGNQLSWLGGRGLQAGGLGARLVGYQFEPAAAEYYNRSRMFESPTFMGSMRNGVGRTIGMFSQDQEAKFRVRSDPALRSDPAAAKAFTDDYEAQRRALQGATKETFNLSRGLRDATRGAMFMAGNMGRATGNMVGAGAGMAARGFGAVSGALMSTLGPVGLGLGAYFAYDALRDKSDRTPVDRSNALQPYFAAGGIQSVSPFTTVGSDLRRTPSTVAGATRIGPYDSFVAQNRQMSNPALSGMTQQQALAYLSPQFPLMRRNPQSIDALKLDLIKQYGTRAATSMLGTLQSGGVNDPNQFMTNAQNQDRRGWFGFMDPSGGDISKQYDYYLGIQKDRVNLAAQRGGQIAGFNMQRRTDAAFFGDYARTGTPETLIGTPDLTGRILQGGFRLGGLTPTFAGSQRYDPINAFIRGGQNNMTTSEESFLGHIQKNFGFTSDDFGEDQYRAMREHLDKNSTNAEAFHAFLDEVFKSGDVNREAQQRLLDRYKIKPDTSRTDEGRVQAVLQAQQRDTSVHAIYGDKGTLGYREAQVAGAVDAQGNPLVASSAVQASLHKPEDVNKQIKAMTDMYQNMVDAGKSAPTINRIFGNMMSVAGNQNEPLYGLAQGAQQLNMQAFEWSLPNMGRPQAFSAESQMFQQGMKTSQGDMNQQQEQQKLIATYHDQVQQQTDYFRGLLYQQREYDVMRSRAQEDYNLQRTYQEQDFQRTRQRAEEDYNIQRQRAEYQFHLSMDRAQFDFNLQRRRQEEDFNHQRVLMFEQASQQMYNIYQRIQVQQTSSAGFTLFNADDQLKAMRQQEADLKRVRAMGLSTRAVQTMDLTNPQNAQQLSRFVSDFTQNPNLIRQFNKMAQERFHAAAALTSDESSSTWREFNRQYRLQRDRALTDFQTSQKRARQDFSVQMDEMNQDFTRMMSRQQEDYQISVQRQADAYHKTMQRAAEDLNRQAKTIDGNFTDILTQAVNQLSGHARKQAQAVLGEFKDLKGTTGAASVEIMRALAAIYGVPYHVPKGLGLHLSTADNRRNADPNQMGGPAPLRNAEGGVLPGFTPGQDIHVFHSTTGGGSLALSGGEAVMRPEWTRAVGGEKAVNEMNRKAKYGQTFAGGGVFKPVVGAVVNGGIQNEGGFAALDLDVPLGTPVHAIKDARVAISRDLKGHEPRLARFGVPQNGYYSYGRYIVLDHGTFSSIYAHLSERFAALHQQVQGGNIIGKSGQTGYASGPHVHFGTSNGVSPWGFVRASSHYGGAGTPVGTALAGGAGGMGGPMGSGQHLSDILKDRYPQVEKFIEHMQTIMPVQGKNDMSGIMNKFARAAFDKYKAKYGNPYVGGGSLSGLSGFSGGGSSAANIALGKRMAAAVGWTGAEWNALLNLWNRESGWDSTIHYGGGHGYVPGLAYGIPQALPGDKMASAGSDWKTNAATQIKWGMNYIKSQYTDPLGAMRHENSVGWYGDGAVFNHPQNINVGERGPEMVLPLNEKGADFIETILERTRLSGDARMQNTSQHTAPMAHNMYNTYHVDKSTNFTGPITVQANDVNQFIHTMRQRQRTKALTQPQLVS